MESENKDLKITCQNLVNLLRKESQRNIGLITEYNTSVKDIKKLFKIIDSDQDNSVDIQAMDSLQEKYIKVNAHQYGSQPLDFVI